MRRSAPRLRRRRCGAPPPHPARQPSGAAAKQARERRAARRGKRRRPAGGGVRSGACLADLGGLRVGGALHLVLALLGEADDKQAQLVTVRGLDVHSALDQGLPLAHQGAQLVGGEVHALMRRGGRFSAPLLRTHIRWGLALGWRAVQGKGAASARRKCEYESVGARRGAESQVSSKNKCGGGRWCEERKSRKQRGWGGNSGRAFFLRS